MYPARYVQLCSLVLLFLLNALLAVPASDAAEDPAALALAKALDTTGLPWTYGPKLAWGITETDSHDGVDSARSFVGSGSYWLETAVTGPGKLTFWWKTQMDPSLDRLYFNLDSVNRESITGFTGWEQKTITLLPGTHTLRWVHQNLDDLIWGAWLDQVIFRPKITITGQPTDQTVQSGASATFRVTATSADPPLRYQWRFNGADLAGETGDTLTVANVQLAHAGLYAVSIMDSTGANSATISGRANLSLLDAAAPSVATLEATQVRGKSALLAGTVNPSGAITEAHFEYGLTRDYGSVTGPQILGSAPGVLPVGATVSGLKRSTLYHFRLVAQSGGGVSIGEDQVFTTLNTVSAAVFGAPVEPFWNADVQSKIAATGLFDKVDAFLVGSSGIIPTLELLRNYEAVLFYAGGDSFLNPAAVGNVLADYVDEGHGVVVSAHSFDHLGGRFVTGGYMPFTPGQIAGGGGMTLVKDQPSLSIFAGVVALANGITGYHNAPVSITNSLLLAHWNNGQPLVAVKEMSAGRVAGLNFMPVSSSARPDFWVSTTDGGRLMANALLWAAAPRPTVAFQPANQKVLGSGEAVFEISASTGNPPLNYQWQFNGTNIAGATEKRLVITNVQTANAGQYAVILTDSATFLGSTTALLKILPTVEILPPANIALDSVTLRGTVNPYGLITTVHFDYGVTDGYGRSSPTASVGKGAATIPFSTTVSALLPSTTYHYRLVATNASGVSYSADQTFVTKSLLPVVPQIESFAKNAGLFSVSILTEGGRIYRLEAKNTLGEIEWNVVATVTGAGQLQTLVDVDANQPQKYYRVRVE